MEPEHEASFEAYVRAHGRRLESVAFLLTGDGGRSQDLVQQALLTVYRRWPGIVEMDHPDAYVRRVLLSRFLDWRRRPSSHERPASVVEPRACDSPGMPDPADLVADADLVRRALTRLTRQQRAVLVLRHYVGYDDRLIAATLGCREATVRSHASRGLARMRAVLLDAGPAPVTPAQGRPRPPRPSSEEQR